MHLKSDNISHKEGSEFEVFSSPYAGMKDYFFLIRQKKFPSHPYIRTQLLMGVNKERTLAQK